MTGNHQVMTSAYNFAFFIDNNGANRYFSGLMSLFCLDKGFAHEVFITRAIDPRKPNFFLTAQGFMFSFLPNLFSKSFNCRS
jgi:hypothetical protein